LRLESENDHLKVRLAAETAERNQLREHAAAMESRIAELDEQTIALTDYLAQLADDAERSRLEQTAAPLASRTLWWRRKSGAAGWASVWRSRAASWAKLLRG